MYFFRKSALRCDAISFRRDVLSLLKCALRCTLRFADTLVLYFILRERVGPDTRGAGRPASEGAVPFFWPHGVKTDSRVFPTLEGLRPV